MKSNKFKQNISVHDRIFKKYNLRHTEIYNKFEQDRLKILIKNIVHRNKFKKPSVLDVGAGTGNLSLKFLDEDCIVTASDVSKNSLKLLKKISNNNQNLKTNLIIDENLPFEDNSFDIVVTYSVLHHIPDYLNTVNEMIRVTKTGGLIYIDHEANENKWNPNKLLKEYYNKTNLTKFDLIKKYIKTKDIFKYKFLKAIFIKLFINKKYEEEGDIHVWKDDHIEWNKVKTILKREKCTIIEEIDYLMYKEKGGYELYNKYKTKCNDTKYLIIRKINQN